MAFRVRVKNFQSIRDVEIEVDGLTVVTGTNNSGKSALVRAIHGAFSNARGSDFVRHGESSTEVRIKFSDGHELLWEKGPKVNRYEVDGLVLDRADRGAPKDIQNLGVRSIHAGGLDLWPQIARQLDGVVFLFDLPGHVMTEAVSDAERVMVLTKALRLSESETRQTQSEIKIRTKDLEEARAQEKIFAGLGLLRDKFLRLQEQDSLCRTMERDLASLRDMRNRWLANKKAANLLKDVDRVVGLMPLPTVWDEVPKKCRLLDSWKTLQTTLQVRKDLVRRWQDADFTGVTKGMANIVCQLDRVRSLGLSLAAVKSDFRKIREAIETVDRLSFEENRIDQSAREVRAEMDQMVVQGERCPTCNQELRELP